MNFVNIKVKHMLFVLIIMISIALTVVFSSLFYYKEITNINDAIDSLFNYSMNTNINSLQINNFKIKIIISFISNFIVILFLVIIIFFMIKRNVDLNFKDKTTGIYNKYVFKEELETLNKNRNMPLSMIIVDINGFKKENVELGNQVRYRLLQKIAQILKNCCRKEDRIFRIGEHEFAVIMPKANSQVVKTICKKIKLKCALSGTEATPLSISFGCSTKEEECKDVQLMLKEAVDRMYRNKFLECKSSRSFIIVSLEKALFEKSNETQEHAQRMSQISEKVGQALKLSCDEIDELILLSRLHDIGKIAVSENILIKPGKLSLEEWVEMKKHSEIGCNIIKSCPELINISKHVLSHHERWDGKGYPMGLSGDKIPLLSRVVAIVDTYDAITNQRPYREALSHKEAIEEIERCAGTQFDPEIVKVFVNVIEG